MVVATGALVRFEQPTEYRDELRARADRVRFLVIPTRRYLAIEGDTAPGGDSFRDAIGSLYPVAYGVHFALRKRGVQAPVGALEGLFWEGEPGPILPERFRASAAQRAPWRWRLLLPVPAQADDTDILAAVGLARTKRGAQRFDELSWQPWTEGDSAQLMHIGPYADEPPTIERLHAAIAEAGLRPHGCHHEIYLSDPGRTDPKRLKTLIRQPVTAD